jgi:chromate reductase, NAD(P)H dehydrogenase (quinone)
MRLLAISGSLRRNSSNAAVLNAAAVLVPLDVQVSLYPGMGELPHFNPDLDTDQPPAPVQELRRQIGQSEGLLICSPEYAHGVAGSMKNLLDWLVGSIEFPGKPVAIINASPRAVHAQAQLREILTTMSARLIDPASIDLNVMGRNLGQAGIVADPILENQLRSALLAFKLAIMQLATDRNIDQDRLGAG